MKIWYIYAAAPAVWLSDYIFLRLVQDSQPLAGSIICTVLSYCVITFALTRK